MARQVIEVAAVFHHGVENRRFEADHVNATVSGDTTRVELRNGRDERGPVLWVLLTPNAALVCRPAEDGDR